MAVVPAFNRADTIAATVDGLLLLPAVDAVVVVDDGSSDLTTQVAAAAGAAVVRLAENRGKGAAVAAGVEAAPDADIYLLIDADLGSTSGLADRLLAPVAAGDADMSIAVLPAAGGRGGFGWVKRLAAAGIRRGAGMQPRAPLSGQRAVRGPLLRSLELADRFGLEAGLTIDAVRAGARVVEVDVPMDHRHTGRRLAGFAHRARQGADIVRALWPRLTSVRLRLALMAGLFLTASLGSLWSGARAEPSSLPAVQGAAKVVLFGMPRLSWDDVGTGRAPNLDRLVQEGASAATSVRTRSSRPSTVEGYATLGAGTRVTAEDLAGFAFDAESQLEGGTAAQALARRTGRAPQGEVAVVGGPATIALNRDRNLSSSPGALGDALHRAGRRTAVINNADTGYTRADRSSLLRPAAAALMDRGGTVDVGQVARELLVADPASPFGYRADHAAVLAELDRALATADVVLVDAGDLDRAGEFAALAAPGVAGAVRVEALARTDRLLGEVRRRLGPDTMLMVVSVAPPGEEWRLTPTVVTGPGVRPGYLHSPSTRRAGVVTITDIAPTVLEALGVPRAGGMIGQPLRYRPGSVELAQFHRLDRDAAYREQIYLGLTLAFIGLQAALYLLAMIAFARLGGAGRLARPLRLVVLAISAYPLATFVFRAVPDVAELGAAGIGVLLAIDAGIVALASRARRHPLSPLSWILAATVALLCLDVATGARLQTSSLLGYSLHTAARFTGLGNTAFATLAATTVLLGAIHVAYARRRQEALVAVGLLFAFVILVDGAPALGSDVGGILTLVPVFALTLLVLAGRRLSLQAVLVAGVVALVALGVATGVDLLRPAASRTHLGRLVDEVGREGIGALTTTVSRKLAVNFRTYRSPWSWTVVIVSLYMLYFLGWTRAWSDVLPRGSALRAGVVGALAAGLLGYAVNDSGVVVTALVFVYLGPFLTLLALRRGTEPLRIGAGGRGRIPAAGAVAVGGGLG